MLKCKKESQPFSIRMDKAIFYRLEHCCEESGQSKTIIVERALSSYIDEYDARQKVIREYDGLFYDKQSSLQRFK